MKLLKYEQLVLEHLAKEGPQHQRELEFLIVENTKFRTSQARPRVRLMALTGLITITDKICSLGPNYENSL